VILDNDDDPDEAGAGDEAEGASSDVDTGSIERDASLHNTFATSELASEPHHVPPAPAQAQPQTLPQSSKPLQDQTKQQGVGTITRSTSVESVLHSLPKPSDSGDDGWTDESMAELDKELGLALIEQGNLSSASAPTSLRPRSVEAQQVEIHSQEHTETTGSRPEELQDTSRHGTAQSLEEWEQLETEEVVEGGGVAMLQQQELAVQKEELGQPAVGEGYLQDLVEAVDADDPKDKEATEALLATQLEIPDGHHFRLRGIRTQRLAGRQTKTTQYQVVWGEHPNRSDSWVNEDDVQISISMPRPPCEQPSQDLVPQVERDVVRVHRIRCSKRSKGKKIFEYLVDKSRWITENQLRISPSPTLLAGLNGKSLRHEPPHF
jgi:hypothetical protein